MGKVCIWKKHLINKNRYNFHWKEQVDISCNSETKPESPDIRSAPRRQSHLSERPVEGQISSNMSNSLINIPHWAVLSTGGRRETDGSQTELLDGILTVSFNNANNETGERRGWTWELPLWFPPVPPPPFSDKETKDCVCVCLNMRKTETERKR